ncbi:hypothetical protein JAAARDRAFT_137180 [Jaapia argillacea MUCL 33604]|uniref:deoxyribose-phosphate aldolase n=1 Tax=Jaapia argillacea MUCL 33604 TaxID=933084 RepID=A0A067PER0_9AGAM|nr:hypothetical protein JAAARDRAFT_137180 [Jaapia argillacea MUCL 33604]
MTAPPPPSTIAQLAKLIDHSLLHPSLTDAEIKKGLEIAKQYGVATACIKPYSIPQAIEILSGTGVGICVVIAFPHGNSTTPVKIYEATQAMSSLASFISSGGSNGSRGLVEIDMVINIGKALSGEWGYVEDEITAINDVVIKSGGALKVIFENDFLEVDDSHIRTLCAICTRAKVAFVKTSTGFGFVKDKNLPFYSYKGATVEHIKVMKESVGEGVQIKAAGGIRSLGQLLDAWAVGATRFGATATEGILREAREKGWPEK